MAPCGLKFSVLVLTLLLGAVLAGCATGADGDPYSWVTPGPSP